MLLPFQRVVIREGKAYRPDHLPAVLSLQFTSYLDPLPGHTVRSSSCMLIPNLVDISAPWGEK